MLTYINIQPEKSQRKNCNNCFILGDILNLAGLGDLPGFRFDFKIIPSNISLLLRVIVILSDDTL